MLTRDELRSFISQAEAAASQDQARLFLKVLLLITLEILEHLEGERRPTRT